ncbi:hypothetical protein [Gluconobacter sp. P1C6_b]|uniref:hypothetical protein n=1 Tax=Gluconobacter sp. P1C6_b TaxID=2762619 RepID=UPI001C03F16E|nr:hypothetical protein [Gluconobacter sp. P1C6_b]
MCFEADHGDAEIGFKIDGFKLSGVSLKRAEEYLKLLNQLLGKQKSGVALRELRDGSLVAAVHIESAYVPSVLVSLQEADESLERGDNPAVRTLMRYMRQDGGTGAKIWDIKTQRPLLVIEPQISEQKTSQSLAQDDSLRGRITALSLAKNGRKYTGTIQSGGENIFFSYKEDLASTLKEQLWGNKIELQGAARWQRSVLGSWKLTGFDVHSVKILKKQTFKEIRQKIKDEGGFGFEEADMSAFLKDVR